jgi:ketosteroid isomerase-like protein
MFNKGDANLLSEFYSNDAINHQVANQRIRGKEAIKNMFAF